MRAKQSSPATSITPQNHRAMSVLLMANSTAAAAMTQQLDAPTRISVRLAPLGIGASRKELGDASLDGGGRRCSCAVQLALQFVVFSQGVIPFGAEALFVLAELAGFIVEPCDVWVAYTDRADHRPVGVDLRVPA